MRKLYFLLLTVFAATLCTAQINSYTFSQAIGTYTPITGGTAITYGMVVSNSSVSVATLDDDVYRNQPIGFTFNYNGVNYTEFGFASNGYLVLGNNSTFGNSTTPISSTTADLVNLISTAGTDIIGAVKVVGTRTSGSDVFTVTTGSTSRINVGDSITGTGIPAPGAVVTAVTANTVTISVNSTSSGTATHWYVRNGEIRYQTIGSAPNRTLVLQYSRFARFATTYNPDEMNFQFRLNETSNTVEIVYGTWSSLYTGTAGQLQVGLKGNSAADFNNRTTTTDWSASTAGTTNTASMVFNNTAFPASGLTYIFTPLSCSAPINPTGSFTTPSSATFNWTPPVVGDPVMEYQYEVRTSGAPGSGSTGLFASGTTTSTSVTINGLSPQTVYSFYIRTACTGGAFSGYAGPLVPAPANDNCGNAVSLTPSSNLVCTSTSGTTFGATASTETAPSCSATGTNDDVWYSFVATSASHIIQLSNTSSTAAAAVYTGSCGALTQVTGACASTTTTASGLTVGNTYYVRVYTTSTTTTVGTDFNICVITQPPPPPNDECAGATAIPLTTYGSNCTYTAVNTGGATISTTTGQANSCTSTGIDDDVFYTFTSTFAGVYTFSYTNLVALTGTASTVGMNLYTGSCGALTIVTSACSSGFGSGGTGSTTLTLAANTTYTLRLWVGSSPNSGTFNFCITAAPAPPANDDCAGSVALPTPSSTTSCNNPIAGTTLGGTQSSTAAPSCSGTGINDDVWYSFVATASTHSVLISNATNTTAAAIYSGTCAGLTQIANACGSTSSGTGSIPVNGLIVGTTYYVRVYSTSTTVGTYSDFNICVISAPANDDCAGAVALPAPSSTATCNNGVAGSTAGSSASADAAPSCSATGASDDVWYSFVATSDKHAVLISNASTTTAAAVYTGSCGSLTQVANACGSSSSGSGSIVATGLTAGNTYYVRVFTTSTTVGLFGTFDICIIGLPANDDCGTAAPLTISTSNACTSPTAGSTAGATQSTETAPSCSATGVNDDVWYSFVATATTHTVSLTNASITTAAAVYSGSCGALTQVTNACASTNVITTGLTVGNTYYVRVYSTSATAGNFSTFGICIGVLPSNDECSGATSLTASSTCNPVPGSTLGSTQSTNAAPSCSGTGINDDVWYSFVATASTHVVGISNASTTTAAAIYSGSCGALAEIACASTAAIATGLTVGNTYYVRVYSTSSTAGTYSTFDICVTVPPANDNCPNASAITANAPAVSGTTLGGTQSLAGCAGTADDDVWFNFVATAPQAVITVNGSASFDAVIEAFDACGGTSLGCVDVNGSGVQEALNLSGLTIGNTYAFRIYHFSSAASATPTFTVSVTSGSILPAQLLTFSGHRAGNANNLKWTIAQEIDVLAYDVERSYNGRTWERVGSVASLGNTSSQRSYTFSDNNFAGLKQQYRLRIIDMSAVQKLSNIVVISGTRANVLTLNGLFPNPAISKVNLVVDAPVKDNIVIVVTDAAGRIVKAQKTSVEAGSNTLPLNVTGLSQGSYVVRITGETSMETAVSKFVKE